MPSDIATAIAYVGAFVGLVGGGVALFNSRMAVAWKRAELANSKIYRTSMDTFLSWLNIVASGLNRKLFAVADIEEVGYWVAKLQSEPITHNFICAYGYQENINKLVISYRRKKSPYQYWVFRMPRTPDLVDDLIVPVRIKLPSPKKMHEASTKKDDPPQTSAAAV